MIVAVSTRVGVVIVAKLQPVTAHLTVQTRKHPLAHLFNIVSQGRHPQAFLTTMFLTTGGFMLRSAKFAISGN